MIKSPKRILEQHDVFLIALIFFEMAASSSSSSFSIPIKPSLSINKEQDEERYDIQNNRVITKNENYITFDIFLEISNLRNWYDENNYWLVHQHIEFEEEIKPLKRPDGIRFVHLKTSKEQMPVFLYPFVFLMRPTDVDFNIIQTFIETMVTPQLEVRYPAYHPTNIELKVRVDMIHQVLDVTTIARIINLVANGYLKSGTIFSSIKVVGTDYQAEQDAEIVVSSDTDLLNLLYICVPGPEGIHDAYASTYRRSVLYSIIQYIKYFLTYKRGEPIPYVLPSDPNLLGGDSYRQVTRITVEHLNAFLHNLKSPRTSPLLDFLSRYKISSDSSERLLITSILTGMYKIGDFF